jgi:hypothetical protein
MRLLLSTQQAELLVQRAADKAQAPAEMLQRQIALSDLRHSKARLELRSKDLAAFLSRCVGRCGRMLPRAIASSAEADHING